MLLFSMATFLVTVLRNIVLSSFSGHLPGGGGEGTPHMKGVGMLVVSLRGVNFRFWSHLGCSGQNAIIFSRKVSFRVAREKLQKYIYCLCFNVVSFRGQKNLGHAQIGLL